MTVKGWKRTGAILGNVIAALLAVLALLLLFLLLQSRLTGAEPSLAGYRICYIRSGSMEPAVKVGSLTVVQPLAAEEIRSGDIITFRGESGGSLITHRVEHLADKNDALLFYTRGDANNVLDPQPVSPEQLVGRVALTVPYLGYLFGYIQTRKGLALLFGLAASIVAAGLTRACLIGKGKCRPADDGEVRAK